MSTGTNKPQGTRYWILRLGVGLCAGLLAVALYAGNPRQLVQVDRHIYDAFLSQLEPGTPSPAPAIIDIDEASLRQYGQWPWPRHVVASLLKRLGEGGAAAIGLDILFSEPDRSSPLRVRDNLRTHFGVDLRFEGLPKELEDNDLLLAEVLRQTPTVLGTYVRFSHDENASEEIPPPTEGVIDRQPQGAPHPRAHLLRGLGITLPLPDLRAAAPLGAINAAPDQDGIVRSIPLLADVNGRIVPSLGLRVLMRGLDVETIILHGGPDGLAAVGIGPLTVPVRPDGSMLLPYRGPRGTYPYFSAKDVLNGTVPDEELEGRLLFLGTSAAGLLDIRATPLDPVFPGVEVHAATVDAILSQRHLFIPPWTPGAQVIGIAMLAVAATLVFAFAPVLFYLPVLALCAAGLIWGSWSLFQNHIFLSPLYALLALFLVAASLMGVRFWQENRQRRILRQAFSRYVAPDMVDRIAERGEAVLTGEERVVTLMFTDIRGFTSLSERLAPAQVVAMLNRYFTPMTALIRGKAGTVDKFIGDAIMAFWNAPLDVPRHELAAIHTGLAMQDALEQLNKELEVDLGISLRMGVGVHTGKVYVGNMGSAELLDYTCIGDTVNLASRLEGLCPVYGVPMLCSADTAEACLAYTAPAESAESTESGESTDADAPFDVPAFIPLDDIRVKGKHQPVEICYPLDPALAADRQAEFDAFQAARVHYTQGDFASAVKAFAALHERYPDILLHKVYLERSQTLLAAPPPDWEGVWQHIHK